MSHIGTIFWPLFINTLNRVQKSFYFHLFINLLINSVTIPLLDQWSVSSLIAEQYAMGTHIFMLIILIECVSSLHRTYAIEPHKVEFNAIAHQLVERYVLGKIETISHDCQKKLLDGDYQTRKNAVKWNLINLMTIVINNIIQFVPMVGYMIWVGLKSPMTIVTYSLGIYLFMKYNKPESVEWSSYDKNWKVYNCFRNNEYSDLIHNRGMHCHDKMSECMFEHEIMRGKDHLLDVKYTENINIVFNIITIINCGFILSNNIDTTYIIIYIQYIRLLKNNLQMISTIIKQWNTTEKENSNYEKLFLDTVPDTDISNQVPIIDNITIIKGSQFIRDGKNALSITNTITLKRGIIVYVKGASGAGKTTLFDIIAGIIKHCKTNFKILVDTNVMTHGFEHIKIFRTYLATSIQINSSKTSVHDIVTSNRTDANLILVWEALKMAECTFVISDTIYKDDGTFSKGQTNRLKVARYLYDILLDKPSLVILDEIADGVDPETTTMIATNIYDYFRRNNILCLVATHLPYLQTMNYDMQINITDGVVSI